MAKTTSEMDQPWLVVLLNQPSHFFYFFKRKLSLKFIRFNFLSRVLHPLLFDMQKILIADDYEDNANVFKLILEAEGYQTKVIHNGLSILKDIEDYHPVLLILDVQLGESDGILISRLIKNSARLKHIKIILTSAGLTAETISKMPFKHHDDFLPKPFDITDLTTMVKSLLS